MTGWRDSGEFRYELMESTTKIWRDELLAWSPGGLPGTVATPRWGVGVGPHSGIHRERVGGGIHPRGSPDSSPRPVTG
jgi:hypothetical protein